MQLIIWQMFVIQGDLHVRMELNSNMLSNSEVQKMRQYLHEESSRYSDLGYAIFHTPAIFPIQMTYTYIRLPDVS